MAKKKEIYRYKEGEIDNERERDRTGEVYMDSINRYIE